MKTKVTEQGVMVPKKFLKGIKEVEIRKDDPETLWMGGHVISFLDGDHLGGAIIIDRALALNPSCLSKPAWSGNRSIRTRRTTKPA